MALKKKPTVMDFDHGMPQMDGACEFARDCLKRLLGKAAPPLADQTADIVGNAFRLLEEAIHEKGKRQTLEQAVALAVRAVWQGKMLEIQQIQRESTEVKGQLKMKTKECEELEEGQLEFWQHVAKTSGTSCLGTVVDMGTKEVLGQGNWGFAFKCKRLNAKDATDCVVVKAIGVQHAQSAVREWQHGASIGKHKNIVTYEDALLHKDERLELKKLIDQAYEDGVLHVPKGTKRRDVAFTHYICLIEEFMDRGCLTNLIEHDLLTLQGIGSVTQQVASALGFLHKKKRTHNDVKPDNILIKSSSGKGLIAKLGDFGLAELSTDTTRDHELFGLCLFCMCTGDAFKKYDQDKLEKYVTRLESALANKDPGSLAEKKVGELKKQLPQVLGKIWRSEVDADEVRDLDCFDKLELIIPNKKVVHWNSGEELDAHDHLEKEAAKQRLKKGSSSFKVDD